MKRQRVLQSLFVAGFVLVTGSCSVDRTTTGPAASLLGHDRDTTGILVQHKPTGLLECDALPAATTTKTIGRAGGVLQVGPHSLSIPAGALDHDVRITARIFPDDVNTVAFSPHGLRFDSSVWVTMSYANCDLLGQLLPKRIAYTDNNLNILYYVLSVDLLSTKQVRGKIDHFSGYAISW
jgi:hypothetical protein